MHPGLDAQEWRLVRAGLHRVVERRARGAVDRARVAAGVRQPPLQRERLLAALPRFGRESVASREQDRQTRQEPKAAMHSRLPVHSVDKFIGVARR
jgi:hypothetical protein